MLSVRPEGGTGSRDVVAMAVAVVGAPRDVRIGDGGKCNCNKNTSEEVYAR